VSLREPAVPAPGKGGGRAEDPQPVLRSGAQEQRARLLSAIVETVAQYGYVHAKIGDIAKQARVSRATFYELFDDKEECFLAAYREIAGRFSSETRAAIAQGKARAAAQVIITALFDLAEQRPSEFSFLTHESMLAGPRALAKRERLLTRLHEQIDGLRDEIAEGARPDVPMRMILGGVIRALGILMRSGEKNPRRLLGEAIEWLSLYTASHDCDRWSTITTDPALLEGAKPGIALGMLAPRPLPKGRHRLPEPLVTRVQRERILHATAAAISANGYALTTVADIVAAAGLSREVFYAHFSDKQEAFAETFKLFFEQIMAACAGAFFAAQGDWPDRVWESGRVFGSFIAAAPDFARCVFIESYAPGNDGAQLTDNFILGFSMFLEDGYRWRPEAVVVPRLVSQAIPGAVFDVAALYVAQGRVAEVPGLMPLCVYTVLAPFTGVEFANQLVDSKMEEMGATSGEP
jgi:AcrR family transcriptional regulator